MSDLMMRLILSRPDVSFRYVSQGKTLYHSAGDGKLSSAVFSIYGREMLHSMHEVDGHQAGLILKGFVGVGESGRGSRNHQSFFINGRYMKSSILSAAVEAACRERVLSGKYPTCVLHLTMPYDTVDVNVHPNKLEVRFQNEAAIAEAVEAIVADALADKAPVEQPEVLRLTPEPPPAVPVTVVRQPVTASETAQPEAAVRSAVPQKAEKNRPSVRKFRKRRQFLRKPADSDTKRPSGKAVRAAENRAERCHSRVEAAAGDAQPVGTGTALQRRTRRTAACESAKTDRKSGFADTGAADDSAE